MNGYDGFSTVHDPAEYMNAPAIIMDPQQASPARSNASDLPLILQAAIDYSGEFSTLSADELQAYYSEQANLERRLSSINNRIEVEFKMREAAQSISKIHADELDTPPKTAKRLSRLLSQDSHVKNEKRLSKQAAHNAAVSEEKIRDLERSKMDVERRKNAVDRTIIQHHCAVMGKAVLGKPLPNHQRSLSGNSITSSKTASRLSWTMAPKHQRQVSRSSVNDVSSLATVSELPSLRSNGSSTVAGSTAPKGLSRPGLAPSGASICSVSPSLQNFNSNEKVTVEETLEELDQLVLKIENVWPQQSPALHGKVPYVANAFDRMYRDLRETQNNLEAARIQLEHSNSRTEYLKEEMQRKGIESGTQNSRSASGSRDLSDSFHGNSSIAELKLQIDSERAALKKWRDQAEAQRITLAKTTKSLEDVTQLAVGLESDRSTFDQSMEKLHQKVASLESEKVTLLQQKLSSTKNTSLLCQEFHQIVADLVMKHNSEERSLYPRFPKSGEHQKSTTQMLKENGAEKQDVQSKIDRKEEEPKKNILETSGPARSHDLPSIPSSKEPFVSSSSKYQHLDESTVATASVSAGDANRPHLESSAKNIAHAYLPSPVDQHYSATSLGSHVGSQSNDILDKTNKPSTDSESRYAQQSSPQSLRLPRLHDSAVFDDSYNSSYDNSIQHTSESLMTPYKPEFSRQDTNMSKSSSLYAEGASSSTLELPNLRQKQPVLSKPSHRQPHGSSNGYEDELI